MMSAVRPSMAPTSRGRLSKSSSMWPGLAVSGQTPSPKFLDTFNRERSPSMRGTISDSTKFGSTVLSTTTTEPGASREFSSDATDSSAV